MKPRTPRIVLVDWNAINEAAIASSPKETSADLLLYILTLNARFVFDAFICMLIFALLLCKCLSGIVLISSIIGSIITLRCSVTIPPQLILEALPCWTQIIHATCSRSRRASCPLIPGFSTRLCCYIVIPIAQQQASRWTAGDGREYNIIKIIVPATIYAPKPQIAHHYVQWMLHAPSHQVLSTGGKIA